MANLTKHLTPISPELRSGPSPGRRLLAAVLCAMLVLGSVLPGVALAGEADSEGEGTAPTVEVPIAPEFDPGGEEGALEEVPAAPGDEESGVVEVEPEVDPEAPVTSAATEAPVEAEPPTSGAAAEPTSTPEPEAIQPPPEAAAFEPVANDSIVAPQQKPAEKRAASFGAAAPESEAPAEEVPSAPQPAVTPPRDHGRHLAGKSSYVVQPGDCLWHIAAGLLPGDADTKAVESKIEWLYQRNASRIGTGDPDLIYPGTVLIVR
ncbi:MAG TPA: hypothetical protein VMS60_11720 [Solirubrobacterales bacterium]|nr:hypothetical protein [Solirubrobacterales bacterium]